jgi:hypothetical protein
MLTAAGVRGVKRRDEPYKPDDDIMVNLAAVPYRDEPWSAAWIAYHGDEQKCWEDKANRNVIDNNLVTNDDPGFADARKRDFTLLSTSRVWNELPAFRRIPFYEIGPRANRHSGDRTEPQDWLTRNGKLAADHPPLERRD